LLEAGLEVGAVWIEVCTARLCGSLAEYLLTYIPRYNKKQVDLSLTYRISGLPSGAQLELVQSSKSPSVVTVALQFPQSENNLRLTEKFPSSTSLWQVLRRFESGTAGGAPYPLNITQRGIAERNTGTYGAGRMFYEMPTLLFMNREFSTFLDLQKTLAQVGVASGSALFRLNFKHSGKPLEDAMAEISEYFKDTEEVAAASSSKATTTTAPPPQAESKNEVKPEPTAQTATSENVTTTSDPMEDVQDTPIPPSQPIQTQQPTSSATSQPRITTFLAPEGPTAASTIRHNEDDYVPTVDHAKTHQARLETLSKNTRLLSDAELETQRQEREAKVSVVQEIRVRFRFPDQTQIETRYSREDTAKALFETVAEVLRYPGEMYVLSYRDTQTGKNVTVKEGETKKLIQGLGWTGSTLVYVSWPTEGASEKARKEPSLKDEYVFPPRICSFASCRLVNKLSCRYLKTATKLQVEQPKDEDEGEEKKGGFLGGLLGIGSKDKDKGKGKSSLSAGEKEAKLGKLLGLGKKR
jgi:tether containing UBX domain for GLUT4